MKIYFLSKDIVKGKKISEWKKILQHRYLTKDLQPDNKYITTNQ